MPPPSRRIKRPISPAKPPASSPPPAARRSPEPIPPRAPPSIPSSCQLRLKIPQSTGRKIPSPQQVVVDGFIRLLEVGNRLVKRRWALVETNPPRNSWPQTHQDDEARDEAGRGIVPGPGIVIGLIDLPMPQKTHARASRLLPRASATAACGSSLGASTAGIRPALRRSFSL